MPVLKASKHVVHLLVNLGPGSRRFQKILHERLIPLTIRIVPVATIVVTIVAHVSAERAVRVLAVRRELRMRLLLLLLHHRCVHVSAAAAGAGRCLLLLLLLLLLRYLLLLLLLLKILRILVRRKLGVRRVRSKVTLATVAVAVHGTRD